MPPGAACTWLPLMRSHRHSLPLTHVSKRLSSKSHHRLALPLVSKRFIDLSPAYKKSRNGSAMSSRDWERSQLLYRSKWIPFKTVASN